MSRFKLRHTFIIIVLFFLGVKDSFGQNSVGYELQRTFEKVGMSDYKDFVLGNSSFLLTHHKGSYKCAYGLEIQEALLGQFGGLYVFGLMTELDYKLRRLPMILSVNSFVGGGGGAGAPDGSGLTYRYGGGLKFTLNPNFKFLLKYSYYNFPTGTIAGDQFQWGFSYGVYPADYQNSNSVWMANQSFSIQSTLMMLDSKDAMALKTVYRAKLLGVEYATRYNKRFRGLFRLQAAVSTKIDGFMAYYTGVSTDFLNSKNIVWNAKTLIGSCGGGGMNTSGGLAYILETGLDIKFSRHAINISRGFNTSHNGSFLAHYFQIGYKHYFESSFLIGTPAQYEKNKDELKATFLGLRTGLNIHMAPKTVDKNGLLYKDMTLMYFGLSYPIHSRFDVLGETRWAMGGDYGAYAEGVFGLSYHLSTFKKIDIQLPIQIVIAGGGGIDVGKGIGTQVNLRIDYPYSDYTNLSLSFGKLDMYEGNYDPFSIHFSVCYDLLIHHK